MAELEGYGNPQTKNTFIKHGVREPYFGVKVQDMKKIVKKVKKNHQLSLELFATGNSDAMYLAGLIADENKITKNDLNRWAREAYWYMISEYTVAWVAAESPHGKELAIEWIESDKENIAAAGWATLAHRTALIADEHLDINFYDALLDRISNEIHHSKNRVRYAMNGFVIAVGGNIKSMTNKAIKVGRSIGKVHVDLGGTACKVPSSPEYIQKVIDRDRVGKKRKTVRC